ncbi:PLP-dependent transferase [Teratosphaeria nubilosa]|uniref:PLP-dependent transferase n=1 Tax=Teratosphaeria nubilosa TaxID=161662 RepID=A0A6G1LE56_9PEZI|nr:PLP-dependent transferase [Teratosphaeria nubilosa]
MAPPPPFAVEQWMDKYETTAKYNIAETCCASVSIGELLSLSENKSHTAQTILDTSAVQNYGNIRGNLTLRERLSKLYSSKVGTPLPVDNILIQPGAIAANFLVFYALLKPGDHVICHYPTYQQLYSVPASLGAEVDLWKSDPTNKWLPDFEKLKAMIKPNTRLIILNNPQNPTGQILPKPLLKQITDLASSNSISILSDEVYRPLFHGISPVDEDFPPSILSLGYRNTIVTGSMSKAYSLAGIRVGWAASRNAEIVEQLTSARDYTTISVSVLDQAVASFALSQDCLHSLLGRNIALAKTNLELLERFIIKHDESCSWPAKPVAGTTAFVKFERDGKAVNARAFCEQLQAMTGVVFLPGHCFEAERGKGEWEGYVRIGFVNRTEVVREGLEELRKFMRREFDDVPLAGE